MSYFALFLCICCFLSSSLSTSPNGKPLSAILTNIQFSSASCNLLSNNDGLNDNGNNNNNEEMFSVSFNASLTRYMPGGDIVYLKISFEKRVLFSERIHLHETYTTKIHFDLKPGIHELLLDIQGGGGAHESFYILLSNNSKSNDNNNIKCNVALMDSRKYKSITDQSVWDVDHLLRVSENFTLNSDVIDTTCISKGIIFIDGKLVIEVSEDDTIATVKQKIYEKNRITPEQQRLLYMKQQMDDSLSLSHYHVCISHVGSRFSPSSFASSSLVLLPRAVALSEWSRLYPMTSPSFYSLRSLIHLTFPQIPDDSFSFPLLDSIIKEREGDKKIKEEEKDMKIEEIPLPKLGLASQSVMTVKWNDITPVVVNYWSGQTIILISKNDSFEMVKNKMQEKIGIAANQYFFLMKNSVPDNIDNFLSLYNFTSRVGLTKNDLQVFIYGIDMQEPEQRFPFSSTVLDIKNRIEEKTGIRKEKLTLFSDSVELQDENELLLYYKTSSHFKLTVLVVTTE